MSEPTPLSPFMSVRDLRAALEGVPDDAQIVVMVPGADMGVADAWQSTLIAWSHDCADAPDDHRPGRDCPTVTAFEIHAETPADTDVARYELGNGGLPRVIA